MTFSNLVEETANLLSLHKDKYRQKSR